MLWKIWGGHNKSDWGVGKAVLFYTGQNEKSLLEDICAKIWRKWRNHVNIPGGWTSQKHLQGELVDNVDISLEIWVCYLIGQVCHCFFLGVLTVLGTLHFHKQNNLVVFHQFWLGLHWIYNYPYRSLLHLLLKYIPRYLIFFIL